MPRTALTLLLILIGSTCILPNVYGGKMPSKPNIIFVMADDMGWSSQPNKIRVKSHIKFNVRTKCVQIKCKIILVLYCIGYINTETNRVSLAPDNH